MSFSSKNCLRSISSRAEGSLNSPAKNMKQGSIINYTFARNRKLTIVKVNTSQKERDSSRTSIQSPQSILNKNGNQKSIHSPLNFNHDSVKRLSIMKSPIGSPGISKRVSILCPTTSDLKSIDSYTKSKRTDNSMFFFEVDQADRIISLDLGIRK